MTPRDPQTMSTAPPPDNATLLDDQGHNNNILPKADDTESSDESLVATASDANKQSSDKHAPAPPVLRRQWHTFHWELNVYSAIAVYLVYNYVATSPPARLVLHCLGGLVTLDAVLYYARRGRMPGVPYTLPMVSLVAMVLHPVRFWDELAYIARESNQGLCANNLMGKFMIFCTDNAICRQVLTGEGTYGIYAHPNALWLFGPRNLIYMHREQHKAFRAILTPALFSHDALVQYAQAQEAVCRQHLERMADDCDNGVTGIDARIAFRSMAAASSQEAFLGPYLNDDLRSRLEQDIVTFTLGFLSFPFPYGGFGLSRAIRAKNRIEEALLEMIPKSRNYVEQEMLGAQKKEPRCMLDRWCLALHEAAQAQGLAKASDVELCSDEDMARTVLDFLFAAQDATNSALTYSLDVLDAHRSVLQQLRNEVWQQCGTNSSNTSKKHAQPIWKQLREADGIPSVTRIANQLVHHKPPVPMIPHMSKKVSQLGGYTVNKGAVIIPSLTYSAPAQVTDNFYQANPAAKPDDAQFLQTLTFGAGQHKCPGRRYAETLLTMFLGVLAQEYDFGRTGPRPSADQFMYFPTLFPIDCEFTIRKLKESEQGLKAE